MTWSWRLPLALGLVCFASTRSAAAWIETSVLSDAVVVEVQTDGQAVVSHDLWMKVRGGPLKSTELDGIDSDAEPLPDAEVVRIAGGSTERAKPLLLTRGDDDSLHVEVQDGTGLRNGTYAFHFKYRTDLRNKSRIDLRGSWAELAWVGPRYRAGLDVAKVTFRLPHASMAPRLPETDPSAEELAQGELPTSALLSTLRRGAEADELELVRPHVAKGEPVLWRIWIAPAAFPFIAKQRPSKSDPITQVAATPRSPLGKGLPLVLGAVLALLAAAAILVKHRALGRLLTQQQCEQRPLVPWGVYFRAAIGGLSVGGAVLFGVRFDAPTLGAVCLAMAAALMAYRNAEWPRTLRAPGRWLPLHPSEAFEQPSQRQPGHWLDASTAYGKWFLACWSIAFGSAASLLFQTQPYLSILVLLAATLPLSMCLTGCHGDLPLAIRERSLRELNRIHRQLTKDARVRVHPIARFGEGENQPDEIRLKILGTKLSPTVISLEIAVVAGQLGLQPCLILRMNENSATDVSPLRHFGPFTRGRNADERVAIFAPSMAARARIIAQVRTMLSLGKPPRTDQAVTPPDKRTSAARSSASASVTSKPAKSVVPDHATRAA